VYLIVFLALIIACTNVVINLALSVAVAQSSSWRDIFLTQSFGLAMITGALTLLLIVTLYHFARQVNFGMANIMLMIGGVSIVGGSIAGVSVRGDTLHWSEWLLLVLILCSMTIRYVFVYGGKP
jgi:hypothetical protein